MIWLLGIGCFITGWCFGVVYCMWRASDDGMTPEERNEIIRLNSLETVSFI